MVKHRHVIMQKLSGPGTYNLYQYQLKTKSFFGLFPKTVTVRTLVGELKYSKMTKRMFIKQYKVIEPKLTGFNYLATIDEFVKIK